MALPKENRLKLAGDFRAVSRSSRSSKEGKLLLKAKPRPPASSLAGEVGRAAERQSSRFGIVISKSVARKAAERNRMRRLLHEALKAKQNSLLSPHDIVLVTLPGFSLKDLHEAQSIVEKLFLKAKIIQQ